MRGLELSREYYRQIVEPAFREEFPEQFSSIAFGLVGAGSEAYGYDDELSKDHDWGPRLCIWIPEQLYSVYGERMQHLYEGLPRECCGMGRAVDIDTGNTREGVMPIRGFYERIIGLPHPPEGIEEWLLLGEERLAEATNGEVFRDEEGEFSEFRRELLSYYPRDIWIKKIVSRCFMISQYGQYNLPRSFMRRDLLAVEQEKAGFCREVASLLFLLKRRYRPFYKWLFRALEGLGGVEREITKEMESLYELEEPADLAEQVELIVRSLNALIEEQFSVRGKENYLQEAGFELQKFIESDFLKVRIGFVE